MAGEGETGILLEVRLSNMILREGGREDKVLIIVKNILVVHKIMNQSFFLHFSRMLPFEFHRLLW